jgi:hypothetical protein
MYGINMLISIGTTTDNVNTLLFLKPKLGKERESDQNENTSIFIVVGE